MIKNIAFISFLFFWSVLTYGQHIARVENVKISSKVLAQEREILVYTPIDYDWRKNEYFNVIYVFDSHSREFFDYTSSIISFITNNTKSYIVVGITSPYNEKLDYARNNDLLPTLTSKESIARYGKYAGNAENFYTYIKTEVIPYINSHYRTLPNSIAIGHSLSASFILDSFTKDSHLFQNYIAISPNLAYEQQQLANKLIHFDYSKVDRLTYLYISNANEGVNYWKEWKPAREKTYSFYKEPLKNDLLKIQLNEFPENNHWNIFPVSLYKALDYYFKTIFDTQNKYVSDKEYHVTIKVKTLHKDDTIYIVGNQESLGNWNPQKIKMEKVSDYERELSLTLKSPAQFKFTKGNWKSEAEVNGTYGNITIKPEEQSLFEFEIQNFFDQ